MKVATKGICSPGRSDKFPPPLMRFLRNNAGSRSRSRGRSRSSHTMFFRKKNSAMETTQEPSSPKVTCMGQVRVKCSNSNSNSNSNGPQAQTNCCCVPHRLVSLFRGLCQPLIKTKKRDSKVTQACSPKTEFNFRGRPRPRPNAVVSIAPPRNAFLLTRCRSAPGRRDTDLRKFPFFRDLELRPLVLTRCKSEPARTAHNKLKFNTTFGL
uniref:Uncharacterized protein n=1 Tax=Cajanus cajan TaxID=3821 RepID=A0A151T2L7_CAJCA|nr:hypothetical protein KK1_023734 [Cajanus cajan]